jgi:ATP/maltotriose-dependent transcriptional regulator MalT
MKQALKMLREAPSSADPSAAVAMKRPYMSRLLAAFEQEEQRGVYMSVGQADNLQGSRPSIRSPLPMAASCAPALIEPLTTQELRVLCLLAAGRSNREIAHALVVSLNPVKSHVKHLYNKLGVNSRVQASARACDLHLL